MGLAFLGDLARQRSLASAALLFLVLTDEIEGLVFLAVGGLAQRTDLFLSAQETLFPAIVVLAGLVALVHNWRRRNARAATDPIEMLDAVTLTSRIGELRTVYGFGPLPGAPSGLTVIKPRAAAISLYARSPERTSPQEWRSASR